MILLTLGKVVEQWKPSEIAEGATDAVIWIVGIIALAIVLKAFAAALKAKWSKD